MELLIKLSRLAYGIMMAGLGIMQIIYQDFRPVVLPPWHTTSAIFVPLVYLSCALLIIAGLSVIFNKMVYLLSTCTGAILLLLLCCVQVPYEAFSDPYSNHLGTWTNALKELALAGSAFVAAGSFGKPGSSYQSRNPSHNRLVRGGSILFSIMMVIFGVDHFLYPQFIKTLVPGWIPAQVFWTYFAGVALFGSGVAIILRIQLKAVAILLGIMLFLWLVVLHIPRAVADPYSLQGNEIASVLEALGFSGVAFLIAFYNPGRKIVG